jgi:diacylglycerol kinase (ATP)
LSRVCFIVNPTAGFGRALKTWKRIEPLAASLGEYGVKFTERVRHGEVLAREAAQEGYDRVVAVGGDGTLNEVGNGLMGTSAALAVIPTGTNNDWVLTVGIPKDTLEATRLVFAGRRAKCDVGLAVGYRHFFNIAGIGFDAEASQRVNDSLLKRFSPTLSTLGAIATTLFRFTGVSVQVQLDDQKLDIDKLLLMAVGITRYYGNGMKILPNAEIDDGLFEIVWAQDMGRGELISLVGKLYKAGHVGHPKVHFARGRQFTATSAQSVAFHLDGDVVGHLPVSFSIFPGALDIIRP